MGKRKRIDGYSIPTLERSPAPKMGRRAGFFNAWWLLILALVALGIVAVWLLFNGI